MALKSEELMGFDLLQKKSLRAFLADLLANDPVLAARFAAIEDRLDELETP